MGYAEKRGPTWRARFKLPDGTYDSKPGFTSKDQAKAYAAAQETDIRRGDFFDHRQAEGLLFSDWAAQWLESIDLAPDSDHAYRKRLRAQLLPQWGDTPISRISTSAFRAWEKRVRSAYSKNYARDLVSLFSMLMSDAVSHQPPLLKASPVPPINRRRGRYVPPSTGEVEAITPEQVLHMAENARAIWGLSGYVFILTKAYCGLRQGEIYGLRREWCYPNWPASDPGWPGNPDGKAAERKRLRAARERYATMPALRVQWQHQYVRPPEGGPRMPALALPKYGSVRNLVLPPFLAELLAELLASHESEWVFTGLDGGPLLQSDFSTYYWRPMLNGAEERRGRYARAQIDPVEGLEDAVPHWLRHAMKAWLDEDGQPRVAVEERMGHRLQGVEGVYSRVTPAMERRIAEGLQDRWEKSQRS
jgi:integrase